MQNKKRIPLKAHRDERINKKLLALLVDLFAKVCVRSAGRTYVCRVFSHTHTHTRQRRNRSDKKECRVTSERAYMKERQVSIAYANV
jgi:hypothetical protein